MKEIAKSYKRHVQKSVLSTTGRSVSRPFLFMQIRCPSQSYDVNIEPAKDEVLFLPDRADELLSLVECIFRRAYPKANAQEDAAPANSTQPTSPRESFIFDKKMLRAAPEGTDSEAASIPGRGVALESEELPLRAGSLKTPWTITAMNAVIKPKKRNVTQAITSSETTNASPDTEVEDLLEVVQQTTPYPGISTHSNEGGSCTSPLMVNASRSPSPRPGPPLRPWVKASNNRAAGVAAPQSAHIANHNLAPQQSGLQNWLTPDPGVHCPADLPANSLDHPVPGSMQEVTSPGTPNLMTPVYRVPSSSQMGWSWGGGQKAFKLPSKRKSQGQLQMGFPPTPPSSVHDRHERNLQKDSRVMPVRPDPNEYSSRFSEVNAELSEIMEFEHRKKTAIAQQRRLAARFSSASPLTGSSDQPEMSDGVSGAIGLRPRQGSLFVEGYDARFGDAEAAPNRLGAKSHRVRHPQKVNDTSHSHPNEEGGSVVDIIEESGTSDFSAMATPGEPVLSPNDPRAYLLRQQRKPSQGKLHRTKSSKLPLESISRGSGTFDLTATADIFQNLGHIHLHTHRLSSIDVYLQHGEIEYTNLNSIDVSSNPDWAFTLHELIKANYRGKGKDGQEMIPDASTLIPKGL